METQNSKILKHLKDHGQITSIIALNHYHTPYLPARIHDLRKMGYRIRSEWHYTKRGGGNHKYVKYVYEGDNKST
jgi:hypothetical protein